MPYLLNQAADVTSRSFEGAYKDRYGMLRTEWRVLFHLGRYGAMTAKEICGRARMHKTKVSRAVRALEEKRFLERQTRSDDRRHEMLSLTPTGARVFRDLVKEAQRFDTALMAEFSAEEAAQMRALLIRLAQL
ncbi:MarR family winged helix-turn-helix transcriptional regulator [Cognatishimia sp. F0-27]|uniref:MarR family winged helix-turn-helix transcriptional regulator n=1 Tax=Cognatishimia sp. F0-27 TaxID=2816855 RepID=UPI00351D4A2D